MIDPSVTSLHSLYKITSTHAGAEEFVGSALVLDSLYKSRDVVFRTVNGEDGVGERSKPNFQRPGSCCEGSESFGPSSKAPPVNGEGLKAFAGWGAESGRGRSRLEGNKADKGSEGLEAHCTVKFPV